MTRGLFLYIAFFLVGVHLFFSCKDKTSQKIDQDREGQNISNNPQSPPNSGVSDPATYQLTIEAGHGGGFYKSGEKVNIRAEAPHSSYDFLKWEGAVAHVENERAAQTVVTMPNYPITLRATFISKSRTKNSLGTVVHIPSEKLLNLAEDLGAKWVRITSVWSYYQNPCSPNIQVHQMLHSSTRSALNRGFQVFMSMGDTAPCASAGNSDRQGTHNDVIKDPLLFYNYIKKTVQHFRSMGVRHFGLWNEPNLPQFWEGTVQQAIDLIYVPGFKGIQDGCREAGFNDCLVMGPELAHVGSVDQWMEAALKGLNEKNLRFDIFTHHIYQDPWTPPYGGDSFLNALEKQRFSFTRRSLIDVLKAVGWASAQGVPHMDVWITETGYKEKPPMDAKESDKQKQFLSTVIDYQLQRPWWTNTLFYQLKDSGDKLDGYGMARGSGRDMEDNWKKKPSFLEVRRRILSEDALQDARLKP